MKDPFTQLSHAAHSGAFGLGSPAQPSPAQIRAGNYAKGCMRLQGMPITIETPMHQPRRGKQDGVAWSVTCMANYGYINGVVGADGDNLDVYVGPVPESPLVVVVNQVKKDGGFDEHKVMLGFHDLDTALNAYMNSYEKGWKGLGSFVACSVKQFKAWIKAGDLAKPLAQDALHADSDFQLGEVPVVWGNDQLPVNLGLGDVMYALRTSDPDKLLLDSATMADLEQYLDEGTLLDALVAEYSKFQRKADQLLKVMKAAAQKVQPTSVEVSKPFKNRGTTQVAMLFVMDDGQTVSVFFHNPDSTPNKLAPSDELISWKWVLNKKDITITVAPERGQDLNPREVARRIMALVEKNAAKFASAAAASAKKDAEITGLKEEVTLKTDTLQALESEIADLTAQLQGREAGGQPAALPEPQPAPQPRPSVGVPDLDRLTALLKAGNVMGALTLLDGIEDASTLRELLRAAGFITVGDSKDEILASVGKDLVRAAKAKVDGHALTDAEPPPPTKPDFVTWEGEVATALAERLQASEGDAQGVMMAFEQQVRDLYEAGKTTTEGAQAVEALSRGGSQPEPGAPTEDEARSLRIAELQESITNLQEAGSDAADLVAELKQLTGEAVPQPAEPAPTPDDDQDAALHEAKAYLDSVIEGTADFSHPEAVMKRLEEIYAAFGEGALVDLFGQAAEAFSSYALKMTAEEF